jgi:hypothetical protein
VKAEKSIGSIGPHTGKGDELHEVRRDLVLSNDLLPQKREKLCTPVEPERADNLQNLSL